MKGGCPMQIAYVCHPCSDEVLSILAEFADDHKPFCCKDLETLTAALDTGRKFRYLVIEADEIRLSEMNRIEEVIHRRPAMRLILICSSACMKSNLSLYPVTFLSSASASALLPSVLSENLSTQAAENDDLLMIRWNKVMYTVPKRDILFLERNARNTFIVTRKRQLRCTAVVDQLEKQMPGYFARCHKSYLVNMYEIEKVSRSELIMKNGAVIPISRTRYLPFLEQYKQFLDRHNLYREVPRQYGRAKTDSEMS